MAIELETLQIIIEANFDKLQQNLDKYLPRLESAVNKIEQVTGRTMDKVESNLDIDRVTQKLSDQFDKMNKQSENQMKRFEELFGKAGEKASKNLASGLGNGRKGAIKEIESTVNEINAKIRQAQAKQDSLSFLKLQKQESATIGDTQSEIKYDNQIASAYASMIKYHDQAKKLAKDLTNEFNESPKALENIAKKMDKNEAKIEQFRAKLNQLNETYKEQLVPVSGSFDTGFQLGDSPASLKTRDELKKVEVQMQSLISESDALQRAQAQTEDRTAALREALGSLNTNLNESSIQTGNARLGVQSLGDNVNNDTAKVSRWGAIWNRTSNVIAHGIRRVRRGFGQAIHSSNRFFRSVDKGSKKSSKSMGTINSALKSITRRLIVFGLIYKSITTFGSYLTKALKTNEQFAASLNQLKVNMATAFYPIYSAVLPAINALMSTLVKVTGYIASFIATLFGTTYSFAKKGAEDLQNAIDDMDDAKNTAKKLQQQLAGFDEINTLSFNSDDDQAGTGGLDWDVEEPETPAWLTDFANKFKEIMSQLFDPIRKAWDKQGKKVMNAFKYSLREIIGLNKEIGRSFMEVWTDGTGQLLIEKLLSLFAELLGVIGDVAGAFKNAWVDDGRGTDLIRSIFEMFISILDLLEKITISFRDAWNDGTGERIAAHLLDIFTNIFNVIRNLAGQFAKAWEEGDVGTSIMSGILGIIETILGTLNKITKATADWAKELDFTPLLKSIDKLLKAIQPLTQKIGDGLVWFYENVLLPLTSYTIEDFIPAFLDLLSSVLGVLNDTIETLQPLFSWLWDSFLQPLAEWTGGVIISVLETLSKSLESIGNWIREHQAIVEAFVIILGSFATAWGLVSAAVSIWNAVAGIATGVSTLLTGAIAFLTSPIGIAIAAIGLIIAAGVLLARNWDSVKEKAEELGKWIGEKWEDVKAKTEEIWNSISEFLSDLWERLQRIASGIWSNIQDVFSKFTQFLTGIFATDWTKSFGVFGNILNAFFRNVENIWNSIKRIFEGIINFVAGVFTGDWQRVWQGVSDIFGGIFDGLVALAKAPINAIINLINIMVDALNSINIDIPKWVPGFGGKKFGFDIPKVKYLAKGGILTRATLFGKNGNENLVGGEAGPEAVLPLNAQVLGGIGAGIASTMGSFSEIIMPDALSSPMPSFAGTVSDQTFSIESLKSSIVEAILLGFQEANIQDTTGDIIIPVSIGTDPLEQILLTTEDRRRLRSNK
ncbi:phage tail protein [Enterococcus sp. BWB1-3]|uniref:phage tail protein n=1 Tax=Enterococcus sp. BWB1-3 TaxID=2787713 RepID=UPI001F362073|nr:phage tail protein [Enterococcus sp. BWB1-3]MBL1228129.1 phage tail protein [Enterococcus sp. BWB1-3]